MEGRRDRRRMNDEWPPSDFRIMSCGALSQEDAPMMIPWFQKPRIRSCHVFMFGLMRLSAVAAAIKDMKCLSLCLCESDYYRECSVDVLMWISVRRYRAARCLSRLAFAQRADPSKCQRPRRARIALFGFVNTHMMANSGRHVFFVHRKHGPTRA